MSDHNAIPDENNRQQYRQPTELEDSRGATIDPAKRVRGDGEAMRVLSEGSGSAAELSDLSRGRTTVTISWDTSGAASVNFEVSPFGDSWFRYDRQEFNDASEGSKTYSVGFEYVRLWVSQNLNDGAIGVKGV